MNERVEEVRRKKFMRQIPHRCIRNLSAPPNDVLNRNGEIMDTDERASNLHGSEIDEANGRTNEQINERANAGEKMSTSRARDSKIAKLCLFAST